MGCGKGRVDYGRRLMGGWGVLLPELFEIERGRKEEEEERRIIVGG